MGWDTGICQYFVLWFSWWPASLRGTIRRRTRADPDGISYEKVVKAWSHLAATGLVWSQLDLSHCLTSYNIYIRIVKVSYFGMAYSGIIAGTIQTTWNQQAIQIGRVAALEVVTTTFSAGTVVNARLALVRLCTCHHVVLVDWLFVGGWSQTDGITCPKSERRPGIEAGQSFATSHIVFGSFLGMYIVYMPYVCI